MALQADEAILQGTLRFGATPMPVIYVARASIGVTHQQGYAIGIAAPHQGEQDAVIPLSACQPTMPLQLEASVVTFDHDQGFPDLAAVCQQKFIM